MKNTLRKVSRSPRFLIGFFIFAAILLTMIVYPLFNPGDPLEMIGLGTFFKPGTYISLYDSTNTARLYTLKLSDAASKRVDSKLSDDDRTAIKEWLVMFGISENEVNSDNTEELLNLWWKHYDKDIRMEMTIAKRKYYERLDDQVAGLLNYDDVMIVKADPETGETDEKMTVSITDYISIDDVANVKKLPLGTDNFGRDVLKELVAAVGVSLGIGLLAGLIATLIGLVLGLLSGYVGGLLDDIIMFFVNLFTVIPGFVLLLLISYSIGQNQRGAATIAIVIGATSWVWTARSVRSQVLSLRNRDHVNLSKLSGHSLPRVIVTDILPYIASYVIMALIVQISAAILSEAQLSMLGLGPSTTKTPTLGLMMNWALLYLAHVNNAWWAYYPVLLVIALISFSLNLMNTGLDQVFNPQLRSDK